MGQEEAVPMYLEEAERLAECVQYGYEVRNGDCFMCAGRLRIALFDMPKPGFFPA